MPLGRSGRVLGINSAMSGHSQAIGFAIPVERIVPGALVAAEIGRGGEVRTVTLRPNQ